MELDLYETDLAVCRLPADAPVPDWARDAAGPLLSITRTERELSIVVAQAAVPLGVQADGGWRAMAVRGPLPFHLVGILASLATPLADAEVPIFAISTHDTDWLLVGHDRLEDARAALAAAGHRVHDRSASGSG